MPVEHSTTRRSVMSGVLALTSSAAVAASSPVDAAGPAELEQYRTWLLREAEAVSATLAEAGEPGRSARGLQVNCPAFWFHASDMAGPAARARQIMAAAGCGLKS